MAKIDGTITTGNIDVTPRVIDFATRFADDWKALTDIMGIMRPIKKSVGTALRSYTTKVGEGGLKGGASVGEGEVIPFTEFDVEEVMHEDITLEKYAKAVTIEAVAKYGADVAVDKTDDAFLVELESGVLNKFYGFLDNGLLKGTYKTWQMTLAMARGAVINELKKMKKAVTDVVGFVNVMDYYKYVGEQPITVQEYQGIQYVKNYLGYGTIFLLSDDEIDRGKIFALPAENIDLYHLDPSDDSFKKLNLDIYTDGITNLIGLCENGNASRAQGELYAFIGMTLWAEYLNGIAVGTVDSKTESEFKVVNPPVTPPATGDGTQGAA